MGFPLAKALHADCAAGFYEIDQSGQVHCGLCGQPADIVTGHAVVISQAMVGAAVAGRPILRVLEGGAK